MLAGGSGGGRADPGAPAGAGRHPRAADRPEKDQWQRAAAALVNAVIPADGQLPQAWSACALLLAHARAVLALTSRGIWRVAQSLGYSGNYAAALDLFMLIAAAHRDSADSAPSTPSPCLLVMN